ncbi:MAG TPA: DUF6631 family protein [Thiohalobacter sp.]|nr:DUF6631 family protein [Thiohalobacter sp.]
MSEADKDAEILFPDQTLEVGGEQVTVREFRYLEGARAAVIAAPLIKAMRELISGDDDISAEALDALIGEHVEIWLQLICMSTGKDPEWIAKLPDEDGMQLSLLFWEVNGPFFTRRLMLAAATGPEAEGLSRLRRSSTNSSAPATDTTVGTSASA